MATELIRVTSKRKAHTREKESQKKDHKRRERKRNHIKMVSREQKRAALHEKLQLLRSVTNSHAVIPWTLSLLYISFHFIGLDWIGFLHEYSQYKSTNSLKEYSVTQYIHIYSYLYLPFSSSLLLNLIQFLLKESWLISSFAINFFYHYYWNLNLSQLSIYNYYYSSFLNQIHCSFFSVSSLANLGWKLKQTQISWFMKNINYILCFFDIENIGWKVT